MSGDIGRLIERAKILRGIRKFFDERGFVEVETPVRIAAPAPEEHIDCPLAPLPGGETSFLRASPELQMKKLLAAGMDKIYQIGPCFREGERGSRHNVEFTMIEWYRKNADYLVIARDLEALLASLGEEMVKRWREEGEGYPPSEASCEAGAMRGDSGVLESNKVGSSRVNLGSSRVDATMTLTDAKATLKDIKDSTFRCPPPPTFSTSSLTNFKRITVRESYRQYAGWDPWEGDWNQDRFDFDMATKIEPAIKALGGGVFLLDYPPEAASLARLREKVAERWEFYYDGIELANCFTELCDGAEQRRRFERARENRSVLGEAEYPLDEQFLNSLDSIGSAAGVALGIDRLVMALTGSKEISEVRVIE